MARAVEDTGPYRGYGKTDSHGWQFSLPMTEEGQWRGVAWGLTMFACRDKI